VRTFFFYMLCFPFLCTHSACTHTEATLHSPAPLFFTIFLPVLSNNQRGLGSNSIAEFCFLLSVTAIQPEANTESPPQPVRSIPTRKLISNFSVHLQIFWNLGSSIFWVELGITLMSRNFSSSSLSAEIKPSSSWKLIFACDCWEGKGS